MQKKLIIIIFALIGLFSCSPTYQIAIGNIKQQIEPTDFITDKIYKNLELEILYVDGCQPNSEAVTVLNNCIRHYCRKTTITTSQRQVPVAMIISSNIFNREYINILPVILGVWQPGGLANFTQTFSQKFTHDDTLVLHILYVPGIEIGDPIAIGEAFLPDSFVIFRSRIAPNWERSILIHEFGHILGLNNEESIHSDKNHPYHCINKKCAMYWCVGDDQCSEQYDEDCQKELYAAGAKRFY